jgi:hypothetical protein
MDENTLDLKTVAQYKARYQRELSPIFEMVDHQKTQLPKNEWQSFVKRVKDSILNSPAQYVTGALPSRLILETVLNELFEENVEA